MADLDLGRIGMTDKGDFVQGTIYDFLDGVAYDNQYWISKVSSNNTTPATDNPKWHRSLNGKPADNAAALANEKAALASEKAALANEKATLAGDKAAEAQQAAQTANEAAEAALAAVVVAELPAVATETAVRNIVRNWTPS